jgi:hypothetical protein
MAKIRIPFLVEKKNRDGSSSWHWQPSKTARAAGWDPVALGRDRTAAMKAAEARNADYDRWKAGGALAGEIAQRVAARPQTGTLSALIARYRRDHLEGRKASGAPKVRPKTRESYETSLERIEAWAGKHPLAYVTPARVGKLRDAIARPIDQGGLGHASAFNLLRVGRQLFSFAESIDLVPRGSNPFTNFGLSKPPSRRSVWTPEDDAAFDAAAYDLNMPSMALARAVALFTAQREGDLIAFTEGQYVPLEIFDRQLHELLAGDDGRVMGWSFSQAKTSTEYAARMMEIPLEGELRTRIEAALRANRARDRTATPPRLVTHLLHDDRTGLPWKQRAFIQAWRKVLDHAAENGGRPEMKALRWHDIRRTRVVRLRRRGMPKDMISAITGLDPKTIDEMLKVYGPIDPTITARAIANSLDRAEEAAG